MDTHQAREEHNTDLILLSANGDSSDLPISCKPMQIVLTGRFGMTRQ